MPGLGRAAGWGDGQCVLVGACDRDVLKAHPFFRERVLALIEALFGAEEQGGLKRNGVRRKRAEVTRLFLGEQGWPKLLLHPADGFDVDADRLKSAPLANSGGTERIAVRQAARAISWPYR